MTDPINEGSFSARTRTCPVAVGTKKLRYGKAACAVAAVYITRLAIVEKAHCIGAPAGKDRATGRRAHGLLDMGVRHHKAVSGQGIEARCGGAQCIMCACGAVHPSQIVNTDEQDVEIRFSRRSRCGRRGGARVNAMCGHDSIAYNAPCIERRFAVDPRAGYRALTAFWGASRT